MRLSNVGWVWSIAAAGMLLAPGSAAAQRKDRDVITREEILNSSRKDGDAMGVVRSLRPHFLAPPRGVRTLGGTRTAGAVLYVNGNKMGELSGLKQILALDLFEVRYLDPSRAENEYGEGHSGGVVQVTLIKGIKSGARITP